MLGRAGTAQELLSDETMTFLGAARTVTGSKYLLETPAAQDPDRCRAVPGSEGAAGAQLAEPADQGVRDRRDRPDARASRSLRISAAARGAGVPRARVLHAGHPGSLPHRAARLRPHPGRGCRDREPRAVTRNTRPRCRSTPRPTRSARSRSFSRSATTGRCRWPTASRWTSSTPAICSDPSYARVRTDGQTILFGGDLGRFGRPVLPDPTMVSEADYLLVESTYGNRVHEDDDNGEKLAADDQGDRGARRAS